MVRPIKKNQIQNLQEVIKETAWKQIAEAGAAALSLRAIARELKITAPAIYNYYPARDALVTALIVDAYNSLADAQEVALANLPENKHAERLSALGLAYREWAVTYPQRYQLIFGTPIPNYQAPAEITVPAAARGLLPLIKVVQGIADSDNLRTERLAKLTSKMKTMLSAWQKIAGGSDLEVLYLALVIWSRVHGLVMIEISHHHPPTFDEPAEFFRREINNIVLQYL